MSKIEREITPLTATERANLEKLFGFALTILPNLERTFKIKMSFTFDDLIKFVQEPPLVLGDYFSQLKGIDEFLEITKANMFLIKQFRIKFQVSTITTDQAELDLDKTEQRILIVQRNLAYARGVLAPEKR